MQFIAEHLGILEELAGEHGFLDALAQKNRLLWLSSSVRRPPGGGSVDRLADLPGLLPRSARVLESLGTPPRPPFPEGYEVDQGDWSLLDPVRNRGPIYRPVS